MRAAEFVILAYLAYLMLVAARRSLPARRRTQIETLCLVAIVTLLVIAHGPRLPTLRIARDWMPAVYILVGYWLSGRFYIGPMLLWETQLAEVDRSLFTLVTGWGLARVTGPNSRPKTLARKSGLCEVSSQRSRVPAID